MSTTGLVYAAGLQAFTGNGGTWSSGLPAWGLVLTAAVVVLVSAVLAEQLWTRVKYDLYRIPMAPDSVPVLGEQRSCFWQGVVHAARLFSVALYQTVA